MQFKADMTMEQVGEADNIAASWAVTRRAALVILARSSDEVDLDGESVEAFMELLESLNDFKKWRESETELLRAAQARLIVVIQNYLEKAA